MDCAVPNRAAIGWHAPMPDLLCEFLCKYLTIFLWLKHFVESPLFSHMHGFNGILYGTPTLHTRLCAAALSQALHFVQLQQEPGNAYSNVISASAMPLCENDDSLF